MKENFNFITNTDTLDLFIGSLLTIFTGIVIFSIQSMLKFIFNRKGKLNIYYKHVPSKIYNRPMDRSKETKYKYKTTVPLWVEFHNTKGIKQVIRNLNILAFYKNKKVDTFTQVNAHGANHTPIANNGSYSFIIEKNEIKKYDLYFVLISEEKIDELKVRYFDKNEEENIFSLIKFDNEMEIGYQVLDKEWHKLSK
ncbi:hypothetical protein [Staphylococcus nepalensis]|uniref:hypothetical protein n=1 Tax=Staphylococcus nepalensis TaxID=214473 RepID=UPI0031B9D141